jgi:hypothetical protein
MFVIFLFFTLTNVSFAESNGAKYEVKICSLGETIFEFAKSHLSQVNNRFKKVEHYRDEIIAWNLHIQGLSKEYICKGGERFYIEYPFPYFLGYSYAPSLSQDDSVESVIGKKFSLMAFYAASSGQFNEENSTVLTAISFKQNSPITLGLLSHLRYDSGKSFSFSAYYSKINSASANIETQSELSIPWEKGTSLYYEYRLGVGSFFVYGGHDFESFSTFNISTLTINSLELVENKIHYGTLGLTSILAIGSSSLLIKSSLSQSFSSVSDGESSSSYNGMKSIIFLSLIDKKKFTYNLFYKRHQLENSDNKLSINRYGIGLGYRFF